MALALTLKSQERMILGGAVIRNTSRHAAHLLVETTVPVLRQRDVLTEEQARTPCGRLCLAVQLLYLEPANQGKLQQLYLGLAQEVLTAAPSLSKMLQEVSVHVAGGDYYRALQESKQLLKLEQALLGYSKNVKSSASIPWKVESSTVDSSESTDSTADRNGIEFAPRSK